MNKTSRWQVAQFFEIRWWKNYLKSKDVEPYLAWKKSYWRDFLAKINESLSLEKASKILDAGCGPAGIFIELQEYDVTAIDPLLDQYNDKLDHFKKEKYPNTKFNTVALESYENANHFDVIFCINAINHVSDLAKAFHQLYKSAKTGGTIVVSIDAHNHSILKHIFRLQPGDILHPHQFDLEEYKKMLTDLNCSILQAVLIKKEFLFNHYVLVARKD
ncbi:class I SAM-dependent methyltransferase [Pedobacter sandarakinus]|uniref:class I SAM-dependent methyltransferase n=1 Tax=Pedobacter sandarakinus TaxID=353156 RepID=UPI0022459017|nr:class I SAM-dependent methyltransferase [Pedobacter sandarakinus]MCX2576030.1 class I SAM-dependent methyltransferase [Pedobacter sandarakinus]